MKKAILSILVFSMLMLTACFKDYSNYAQTDGYTEYISDQNTGCEKMPSFSTTPSMFNSEKACEYFKNNSRRSGDYLITNYLDGVCINRYYGDDKTIEIPEKIDGLNVIKLGSFLEDDVYGAFSDTWDCNLVIPKTVKYIDSEVLAMYIMMVDSPYNNRIKSVTIDEDNPYYCSIDSSIYTKDKKTLLFFNTDSCYYLLDHIYEHEIESFVEDISIGPWITNMSETTLTIGKNVKSISAHVYYGEGTWSPNEGVSTDSLDSLIVRGYPGTAAEKWAKEENLPFEEIKQRFA